MVGTSTDLCSARLGLMGIRVLQDLGCSALIWPGLQTPRKLCKQRQAGSCAPPQTGPCRFSTRLHGVMHPALCVRGSRAWAAAAGAGRGTGKVADPPASARVTAAHPVTAPCRWLQQGMCFPTSAMLGNGTLPALPSSAMLPDPSAGFAFI